MFLANLEEQQKTAFLNLAQSLISADGVLGKDETAIMPQYQQEMGLPISADIAQQPIELSIGVFESASPALKKQVMFELVALAYADKEYANAEHSLLKKISGVFGLDAAFLGECGTYVQKLTALYSQIEELVGE